MSEAALMATQGLAAPEVAYAYARAWGLCQQLGEASQTFAVVTGLFTFHTGRGDVPTGYEFAKQGLRLAERSHEPDEWDTKRPMPIRFDHAKDQHTDADEREGEQRPDVGEVVRFGGIADERTDGHQNACHERC